MDDPLSFIGDAALGTILLMAAFTVFVVNRLMTALGPPKGLPHQVCFELTLTSGRAGNRLDKLKRRNAVSAVRHSIYADFAFLVSYGVIVAVIGSMVAGRGLHNVDEGAIITYIGLAAPLLDLIENFGMLHMLKGHVEQPWPAATTVVSGVKWLLLLVALALLVYSLVA